MLGATVIVVGAALIIIRQSVDPAQPFEIVATIILVLAVAVQRISGISRWLSAPRDGRKEQIHVLAQQALIDLCNGWQVSDQLVGVNVHVWAVPLWYRRLFPYNVRRYLKAVSGRQPVKFFTRWLIRPSFHRAAAVGLVKRAPSGVRFRKGYGLIGVCVANNDSSELITLNTADAKYKKALKSRSEGEWQELPPTITHNISLVEAGKLAGSYSQVIARVVQDLNSGEAIGCVTLSLKEVLEPGYKLDQDPRAVRAVTDLSLSIASVL